MVHAVSEVEDETSDDPEKDVLDGHGEIGKEKTGEKEKGESLNPWSDSGNFGIN